MRNDDTPALVGELDRLLDQERQALLTGDLDRIARLTTLKEALIDRLNSTEAPEQGTLDALRDKISRNQVLLGSAMEGIRTVADRLDVLRRVRLSLDTYDRSGRSRRLETGVIPAVERRA